MDLTKVLHPSQKNKKIKFYMMNNAFFNALWQHVEISMQTTN